MRLIDADALMKVLNVKNNCEDCDYQQGIFCSRNSDFVNACEAIFDAPTIEPERKKGKWTIEDCHAATYPYCCSNCTAHHRARYDFCPTCGADMRANDA